MASNQEFYQPHTYADPPSAYEQDHDPVLPGGVAQWSTIQPGESLEERAIPHVSLS